MPAPCPRPTPLQAHSLSALRQLTLALHAAVAMVSGQEQAKEGEKMVYRVDGTSGTVHLGPLWVRVTSTLPLPRI